MNGNIIFNPIVIDGVMYLQGTGNAIVALDAATGKEIWRHANQGAIGARGIQLLGEPRRKDRRILYLNAGHLTAINAENGETITSFGDQRPRRSADRALSAGGQPAADEQPGPDLREHHDRVAAGAGRAVRRDARRRAGLRRAHRQAAVGVPQHPARGRVRLRHLAAESLQGRRRRAQLERVHRGRGERHRLHPVRQPALRFLRRRSARQQPVRQLARRARCDDRQADLALPDRASRSVGLRPAAGAEAPDHPSERTQHRRRRAGVEAGIPVRLRAQDRPSDLADRRASGPQVGRPG